MAENTIDTVMQKAQKLKQIDLTKEELSDLANDETVDKAKVKLNTKNQLNHLTSEMRKERNELKVENKPDNADEGLAQQLEVIEGKIDAHAEALPEAVSDIKPQEKEGEPSTFNTIKKMIGSGFVGSIGGILRGLSAVMKVMPNISIFGINLQQMNVFEKMYNSFFGATETREIAAKVLKESGIAMREGTLDNRAYGKLHTKFDQALKAELKADASGKSTLSEVEQEQIRTEFTFQKFIESEAASYAAKFPGTAAKGKERATTLQGLHDGASPTEVEAGYDPNAKPTEAKDRTVTAEKVDLRTIDNKRNLLTAVDLNDAAKTENRLEFDMAGSKVTILPPINEAGMLEMRLMIDSDTYKITAEKDPKATPLTYLQQMGVDAFMTTMNIKKTPAGIEGRSAFFAAKSLMKVSRANDMIHVSAVIAEYDFPIAEIEKAISKVKGKPTERVELSFDQKSSVLGDEKKTKTFIFTKV